MKDYQKNEKKVRVTAEKLANILTEFRKNISLTGVAFGAIVYHVDESGSRTVGGKKVLQKMTRTNITVGANYENRINKDLTKQGEEANFTAQAMSGKVYVNDEGVLATDTKTNTKKYIVGVVEHHTTPDTIYFHEGKRISKDEAVKLGLFMPSYFEPKKTMGRGNMSEEKDFHIINTNLDNIISLTLNKTKYIVIR